MSSQKIVFIDAYDSFSNNIINLLQSRLHVKVESIHIDDPRFVFNDDAFRAYLQQFDAVVAGPGPGHPGISSDVGLIAKLWHLQEQDLLPVLGICLGFQSLCLAQGASVGKLQEPRHGLVTRVTHCGEDLFAGTAEIMATQYHSLHVKLEQDAISKTSERRLWSPVKDCRELIPLAWDLSDAKNGPILMSARHCHKPFWGVQYHPESICTDDEGHKLVTNWWHEVSNWNARHRPRKSLVPASAEALPQGSCDQIAQPVTNGSAGVQWLSFELRKHVEVAEVARALHLETSYQPFLLESGTRNGEPVMPETGRCSIIGLQDSTAIHFRYSTSTHILEISVGSNSVSRQVVETGEVFTALENFIASRKAVDGPIDSPFWGGLVGFVSYEAGLETIEVAPPTAQKSRPDIWFVFVERSIVFDHINGMVHVQSLHVEDRDWLQVTMASILRISRGDVSPVKKDINSQLQTEVVSQPGISEYCQKVEICQSHLRAGSSYELCLTDQTEIRSPEDPSSVYLRLRAQNPAPFGAYLKFSSPLDAAQSVEVLSSSPERFLSWTRSGSCQFRPIKGTVKKAPDVTRAVAEERLNSSKERAENLMIVDLIRHDLSGVPGVTDVHVPKLMMVEEYATVYQLVSVISGTLSSSTSGLPILAASLPPGSMTGAPKKRSCQLLSEIESYQPRGLYSGVLGYLDVGGGGDFSVIIRTAFRYGGEEEAWRVGAGGAVTVLSEPEAEWEEMAAKKESLMRVFGL